MLTLLTPFREHRSIGAYLVVLAAIFNVEGANADPLRTAFTYQGQLKLDGAPFNGLADVRLALWDKVGFGRRVGSVVTIADVPVTNGLFTVEADFNAESFNGDARWLEVEVFSAEGGGTGFTTLSPRQPLTVAPYALQTRGIFVSEEQNVGIGTTSPSTKLALLRGRGYHPVGITQGQVGGLATMEFTSKDSAGNQATRFLIRGNADDTDVEFYTGARGLEQQTMVIRAVTGNVGIGTSDPQNKLHVSGSIRAASVVLDAGADIAEPFDVNGDTDVLPGMVVGIDQAQLGKLRLTTEAYDAAIVGVISGGGGINPALTLSQKGTVADGQYPVALAGRVWCWCDAEANGAIRPGDLLTSSPTVGHAMKATDRDRAFGATLGKAMSTLDSGKGLVLMLVRPQ